MIDVVTLPKHINVNVTVPPEDAFLGLDSVVAPSQPRLKIFNVHMLVNDFQALPNDKFNLVHSLFIKVHPDRRPFVNVVYNRLSVNFEIVPCSKPLSSLSYEEFTRGSKASNNISFCTVPHIANTMPRKRVINGPLFVKSRMFKVPL